MNAALSRKTLTTLSLLTLTMLVVASSVGCADAQERTTPFPATASPDHIALTWTADARTTQAVTWRTDPTVNQGAVRYRPADKAGDWKEAGAVSELIVDFYLDSQPLSYRHSAVMTGLKPGTAYSYRVGNGEHWSGEHQFVTAPGEGDSLRFIYMGDAQNGLETWGELLHAAHKRFPGTAFYTIAGDLVNRGNFRDDWDRFFEASTGVFDTKQLLPAIGNHEYHGVDGPWMYREMLALPASGPRGAPPEHCYSIRYGDALFVILDSNIPAADQAPWLQEQLEASDAPWKFAMFHHPAYSSKPSRDNPEIRASWLPLFEEYGVDMVLQGHDHAYLRTVPMLGGSEAKDPAEGIIYVVAVSGTKYYDQAVRDYVAAAYTELSTYQVIDIEGNQLTYRAYDIDGNVVDEVVIEK